MMAVKVLAELDEQGGFTAVDLVSGVSAYAYPTSPNAVSAKTQPAATAKAMVLHEIKMRGMIPPDALSLTNAAKRDAERVSRLRMRNGLPATPARGTGEG